MGFTAFLAQISPCFQYTFNPFLGSALSSLSLLHSDTFLLIHFSTSSASSTSPYIPDSISLQCFWDMHPLQAAFQKAIYYHMEPRKCMEKEKLQSVSILSCSFKAACTSLYSRKPAASYTSLNLGIHVKKCWFLLESTEKHLRRAIWSRQVRIWSTPLLQPGGLHAEKTTSFASRTGQGEGWSALQSTANVSLPQCYWFEKPQQSKETRKRYCQAWNSFKNKWKSSIWKHFRFLGINRYTKKIIS